MVISNTRVTTGKTNLIRDKRSLYVGWMVRSSCTQISLEKKTVVPGINDVCVAKCSFLTKSFRTSTHIHTHHIPGVDSRGGEQEAAQAAVGVAFTFNLRLAFWEGLNDLYKGLWKYTCLIVHSALKRGSI